MPKFIVPLAIELPEPEKIDLDAWGARSAK